MSQFENVAIIKKANFYFEGNVFSRTVMFPDRTRKTLGVMLPGEYKFDTFSHETMEIISGEPELTPPGTDKFITIHGGDTFEVPADASFKVNILKVTDNCCSYI